MDAKFTVKFWKALFKGLRRQLNSINVYHSQMDGHTKRVKGQCTSMDSFKGTLDAT